MTASDTGMLQRKRTVEDSCVLSISMLREAGVLAQPPRPCTITWRTDWTLHQLDISTPHRTPDGVVLHMTYALLDLSGREHASVWSRIGLVDTPCYFGGRRAWFVCPTRSCERRVASLYLPPGAGGFLCRHCHKLTYEGRQRHRGRIYEAFGRFGLYARRLEAAHGQRQRLRWLLRLLEAKERIKVYNKTDQLRFLERLNRLRRG